MLTSSDESADEPALAQILAINHGPASQLDTLSGPVHPREINVQRGLDDAENDARRVVVLITHGAHEPVEEVERAVGTQSREVERIDDGRHGGLAKQEELRYDARRFEYQRKHVTVLDQYAL